MRIHWLIAVMLLVACGGQQGSAPTAPVTSSREALQQFMKAAKDSDLTRMSQLWGGSGGPAAETGNPPNYEKRLAVIQLYLRADSSKVLSDMPVTGDANRRKLVVLIYREGCMKQLPATLVKAKGAWIVNDVELASVGNPARPCENSQ